MMERRRALTIPFNVDKNNLMDNPLKISVPCLSSKYGKLERQVSWTTFADCKRRHRDSQHKNGSMLFDHKHATLEMARRKPRLILTDVLETELGKAYIERMRMSRGRVSSTQRESGRCREEPLICRDMKSSQREARNDKNKSVTPKCNQKTTSSPTQRSRLKRRSQNVDDGEDIEESKDIKEVIIGKDNGDHFKFAEVVDCGLSVSWEPAEDTGRCDEFSPASIKDKWTDPEEEVQHSVKRKRKDAGSQCNGIGSPKLHRESVLRLTGEDRRDGGPAPTRTCLEESGEDGDLGSLDRTIVQFAVGADDQAEVLVPIISPNLEAGDFIGTPSLSSSQDNTNTTSPSEPIVLSSDDEESGNVPQRCSPAAQRLITVGDTVIQGQSSQEAVAKRQEASDIQDMQVLHVVVDVPGSVVVSPIPSINYSFSTLHCGGYKGKANGDIMIADQEIIIPLTDADKQVDVMLIIERKDLRRYSVWEQQELEDREFHLRGDEDPFPAAVLLFCVSETAAAALEGDLLKLCVKQDGTMNTGKVSPFILLTLTNPVEGMEGALMRSLLDIDCLNSLAHEESIHGAGKVSYLEGFYTPVLSLDDSIELIRRTGLDTHLLSLLGLESTDPRLDTDQDGPYSDTDESTTPHIQLEGDSQKETVLELETATEQDTGTQIKPEEDRQEQDLEHPSEKKKEDPTPVYTLCHRRTRGSYSAFLCKPDSRWTKFKHHGLARRLIQFPPPPLKGGITVTMEDLQCLDSGHFLNDVIIDFYLKYLLQNASAAVAERTHVFSSFFYKQLTRRDNASEGVTSDSCQRQRRHQRVKTWTRHVDIFNKDFLFVPVNQEAHWYLVVICFPGLDKPKSEAWSGTNSQTGKNHGGTGELQEQEVAQGSKSPNDDTETPSTPPTLNHSDSMDTETEKPQEESTKDPTPGPVNCTERTFQKKTVSKRPCILIMDSLKLSLHERVFKLLREYLQSEWEVRRGSSRDFSPDQMQSSHCQVPLQDNSSDCGLYLLQYVESFLKDPVVHFDLPLQLQRWFPRQQVRRKRDEIRDLVLNLYRHQNLDSNR
ncbi:sentrin-specific protease 7 isoform X1 [Sander lucioperca]|uniref:sentrin-specific protease 7 isoform X1 n=2 Tax=Sander lucioperca TaxID=283035 RepID=UPI00125D14E4|nr:sentrin-specific protease 7 isoform X1 [Sander lucioperca]XP_031148670.1 sentrin-specific protease 7 isoform X1 [Sander lucioperca]